MKDKKEETIKKTSVSSEKNIDDSEKVVKKRTTQAKKVEEKREEPKEIIKEVIVEKNNGFNYAEVIVIMVITLILGGVIGSFITYVTKKDREVVKTIVKNNSTKSDLPSEFDEFLDAYNNIVNGYYEDVDSKKLIEAGISGMLNYLGDDYSVYMDEETSESFNEQVEGKYTGIGVEIVASEDGVTVNRVFEGSPAKEAGLEKGDIFIKVDGEDVTKKTPSDLSTMIRGSKTGKVKVVIKRGDEEKEYTLKLKEVNIENVEAKVIEKGKKKIGYIELSIFAENTYEQFNKKLKELEKENIDSLIIDVRDNSGGYLTSVTSIASLFLDKNKVIYQLDTKGIVEQVFSLTKEKRKYPIVVLVNGASASASEILAAALQESYGATVIGTSTFGKGTVQAAYQLESGAIVKYTIQKWLTPKGNWIDKKGVTPDIEIELSQDYYNDPKDDTDNQLQKALEELSK